MRLAFSCLAVLAALATSAAADTSAGPSGLGASVRARVLEAARDPALAPWQRGVMRDIAGTGATREPRPGVSPGASAGQTTVADGTWKPFAPEQRETHSAIYDPVRGRMIVFGGYDNVAARNDTWVLSLSGTPTWTELVSPGTRPPGRYAHSAIYDALRDRMVIFGGYDGTNLLKDVWALSLSGSQVWTNITPPGGLLVGPTPRNYHTAIYDPLRDRMLIFGGYDSFFLNDVWALPFAGTPAWTQLAPAGTRPGGLSAHLSIYDPVRDRMVVFGGFDGSLLHNETWALTLSGTSAWSRIAAAGTPPAPVNSARGAYDSARDRLVFFGGYDNSYENAVWALTLGGTPTWSVVPVGGALPHRRADAGTIYDPVGDRIVVCDGTIGLSGIIDVLLDDTWLLPLGGSPAWIPLQPAEPAGREWATATVDPVGSRLIVFGGHFQPPYGSPLPESYYNDTYALPLIGSPVWTNLAPTGTPPAARAYHSTIYDPLRNRLIVFGGFSNLTPYVFNDVWQLSLTGTPAWTQLTPSGTPPPVRRYNSTVYDSRHDRILVFGGSPGVAKYNDVWELTLSGTTAWNQLAPAGALPPGRESHIAIYDPIRDRMLVYGGYNSGVTLFDLWALNLSANPAWVALPSIGSVVTTGLDGAGAFYDSPRDRVLAPTGGQTVAALSLTGTPTWTLIAPAGSPPNTHFGPAQVAYDRIADRALIFGGSVSDGSMRADAWALYWGMPLAAAGAVTAPERFEFAAPWPNPFRSNVRFEIDVPRAARVRLSVYDLAGRRVRLIENARLAAGHYTRSWDGADERGLPAAGGIYFIGLSAPGTELHRKIVLLR